MKKILLFHVNIFKQNSLRKLCDDLGIETCVVTDRELPVTLGVIAGMSVPEGPFDAVMLVPTRRGWGSAGVFGASDGEGGAFTVSFVEIAPYAPGLEEAAGPFPEGAAISDCLPKRAFPVVWKP